MLSIINVSGEKKENCTARARHEGRHGLSRSKIKKGEGGGRKRRKTKYTYVINMVLPNKKKKTSSCFCISSLRSGRFECKNEFVLFD